jgi:hypothetical protein
MRTRSLLWLLARRYDSLVVESHRADASVEIHLEVRSIKVSVADTGRGIPPNIFSEIHAPGGGGGESESPGCKNGSAMSAVAWRSRVTQKAQL